MSLENNPDVQPIVDTPVDEAVSSEPQSTAELRITSDGEIQISDSFFDLDDEDSEATAELNTNQDADPTVQPYTPDEVASMGIENLDPSRIPEAMKPFYKSMQADYTRKTQALAEERRVLEQRSQQFAQPPVAPTPPPVAPPVTPPQNTSAEYYEKLYATASQAVQNKLGVDFDEFNPVHIAALSSEVADIQNKISQHQQHKQSLDSVVGQYTSDARWGEIQSYADKVLENLPYGESKAIRDRIQSGDIQYIDKFLSTAKQVFYETNGGTTVATPPPFVPNIPFKQPIKPPVLEGGGTGTSASPSGPVDLKKLGSMSNEALADLFVKRGFGGS